MSKCKRFWENRAPCNILIFIYLYKGTLSLWLGKAWHWDVSQLYCYKLDIIKVFRLMISLTPGGLYKELVARNGHLIALLCLPVSDLSPVVREVMVCASFRYPHAVLPGSMLMQNSQLTLKSVFHILHSCFPIGKSHFCLLEVLVPFPMARGLLWYFSVNVNYQK